MKNPILLLVGLDIPDYVTVRTRERPGQFREEIIKRFVKYHEISSNYEMQAIERSNGILPVQCFTH